MRKFLVLVLLGFCVAGLFAQNNLTQDQIRDYAVELGVPFDALQRLVDTYRSLASGNPILIDDARDLPFFHNNPLIAINQTYVVTVDAWFANVLGDQLFIGLDSRSSDLAVVRLTSRIPDFRRNDPVRIVFSYYCFMPNGPRGISQVNSTLISIEPR